MDLVTVKSRARSFDILFARPHIGNWEQKFEVIKPVELILNKYFVFQKDFSEYLIPSRSKVKEFRFGFGLLFTLLLEHSFKRLENEVDEDFWTDAIKV